MLRIDVAHWTQNPLPDRQAALLVGAVRQRGGNPCVLPLVRGSLFAYTRPPKEVTAPAQLHQCELVLGITADPRSLRRTATATFAHHWLLDAWTPIIVYSQLPRRALARE